MGMKGLTLRRIADECGGVLYMDPQQEEMADREVEQIVTDSRKASPGSLFAAIPGTRVDGHDFIDQVFEQGAACVLSERVLEAPGGNYILVRNTQQALGRIARSYLDELDIPVVGITGSVGKTSTKEMIASVLAQKFCTHKTPGNFNNELGLPMTVFGLTQEHEIAVLEMGINHFGEMHRLAAIARPDVCVITNIGECHLEYLQDRDGVLRAKSEIFDFLTPEGAIILNGNDDKLSQIREAAGVRPVFFGLPEEAQEGAKLSFYADQIKSLGLEGTSCVIHMPRESFEVRIPIPGRHMVMNALAAAAVGCRFELTAQQIRSGIESVQPVQGRFRIVRTPQYLVVDDCYNANPVSVKASLSALAEDERPTVAILGDMAELGENELELHRETGRYAARCGLRCLVCIGERSRAMAEAAKEEAPGLSIIWLPDPETFLRQKEEYLKEGDVILVKASHSMKFETIVQALV